MRVQGNGNGNYINIGQDEDPTSAEDGESGQDPALAGLTVVNASGTQVTLQHTDGDGSGYVLRDVFLGTFSGSSYSALSGTVREVQSFFSADHGQTFQKYRTFTAVSLPIKTFVEGSNSEIYVRADVFNGGTVGDRIWAYGGNDTLSGGGGNDTLCGGAGNDVINGGAGTGDIACYDGARSAYQVRALGNGRYQVKAIGGTGEGTDTLSGIEYLTFGSTGALVPIARAVNVTTGTTTPGTATGSSRAGDKAAALSQVIGGAAAGQAIAAAPGTPAAGAVPVQGLLAALAR